MLPAWKASADMRKNQLFATLTMEFQTRPGVAKGISTQRSFWSQVKP